MVIQGKVTVPSLKLIRSNTKTIKDRKVYMHNEVLKEHARNIRKMIIEMIHAANSGHPGGALSATDVMTYLYFEKMDITKENVVIINARRNTPMWCRSLSFLNLILPIR